MQTNQTEQSAIDCLLIEHQMWCLIWTAGRPVQHPGSFTTKLSCCNMCNRIKRFKRKRIKENILMQYFDLHDLHQEGIHVKQSLNV